MAKLYNRINWTNTIAITLGATNLNKMDKGIDDLDNTQVILSTNLNNVMSYSLTENKTIYVSTTGNDTTGTGTVILPYKTWAKALSMIPKNQNGFDATLNVAGGTYAENVIINGFHGGSLNIVLNGATSINSLYVQESTQCYISSASVVLLTISTTTTSQITVTWGGNVRFLNVNLDLITAITQYGILIENYSSLTVDGTVTITNANNALGVTSNSTAYIGTLAGSGNNVGIRGTSGSKISYGTKTLTATTEKVLTGGAIVTNETSDSITTLTSNVGILSTLTTTIKTSIVNAINWMMGTLLPQTATVSATLNKPTFPVYGQTYRYYFVACRYANLYRISGLSVTVIGLGGITGVSVVAQYTNGFLVLDTLEVGNGYPIQIIATLTKI